MKVLISCLYLIGLTTLSCSGEDDSADGSDSTGGTSGVPGAGGGGGAPAPGGSGGTTGTSTIAEGTFSFFVVDMAFLQEKSQELHGDAAGLGGDLGGLAGADAYCTEIANRVAGSVTLWQPDLTWRAFLSTAAENAIDRIGTGPWYNARGLLMAENVAGLLQVRPAGSTETVWNDGRQNWPFNQCLTDAYGVCVHDYGNKDTHDTLTGSNRQGTLYGNGDDENNCFGWTDSTSNGRGYPAQGHTWPRQLNSTDAGSAHWIQAHEMEGCGRCINTTNSMGDCEYAPSDAPNAREGVGAGGGYGGWYCFAVTTGRS